MTEELSITYEGARLALSFSDPPQAALRINGLIRETAASEQSNITLKLTSTVQTDYEWHEFIEGIVEFSDKGIKATLIANGQVLDTCEAARSGS